MINRELIQQALNMSGAKKLSDILPGRLLIGGDIIDIKAATEVQAITAEDAAAAFATVIGAISKRHKSKTPVKDWRATHTFVGYGAEVLLVNMPEQELVKQLTATTSRRPHGRGMF